MRTNHKDGMSIIGAMLIFVGVLAIITANAYVSYVITDLRINSTNTNTNTQDCNDSKADFDYVIRPTPMINASLKQGNISFADASHSNSNSSITKRQNLFVEGLATSEVTQTNIDKTICVPGWTSTIRPPATIARAIKVHMMNTQSIPIDRLGEYQLDHIVPLCLGGDPESLDNLQLQHNHDAKIKDKMERKICCMVCSGQVKLSEARKQIEDWKSNYQFYEHARCVR